MQQNEIQPVIDFHSLGHKKILLAEDVAFNQYIAKQMLESWGFEVTIANNGLEVLDILQSKKFDCILMDIQMPEMGGIEAAQLIRKFEDTVKASIPIIAVTANALKGDAEKYAAAGMSDYLSKPFDEPQLFRVISQNLLDKKQSLSINEKTEFAKQNTLENQICDKLYDLSMIQSVSGGDESFIKKMALLFIETVPQNVNELKTGLQKEDWEQVSKMAHKLKSTVDSMGIRSLKTVIRSVEANAKQKILLEEMPVLIFKIEADINACIEQLRTEILQIQPVDISQ
jgi:CheY-like chemotaxis protein/HPt (histidine-containing phosphotransfer) domain-containing protein